jgi:hypothetical protein
MPTEGERWRKQMLQQNHDKLWGQIVQAKALVQAKAVVAQPWGLLLDPSDETARNIVCALVAHERKLDLDAAERLVAERLAQEPAGSRPTYVAVVDLTTMLKITKLYSSPDETKIATQHLESQRTPDQVPVCIIGEGGLTFGLLFKKEDWRDWPSRPPEVTEDPDWPH